MYSNLVIIWTFNQIGKIIETATHAFVLVMLLNLLLVKSDFDSFIPIPQTTSFQVSFSLKFII